MARGAEAAVPTAEQWLHPDAVARRDVRHPLTNRSNPAAELVAAQRPAGALAAGRAAVEVKVAAADAGGADAEHDLVGAGRWVGRIGDGDLSRAIGNSLFHDGFSSL